MPTENKPAEPAFNLDTPDGGRGYIANLFKTVLKRHDYRQYISERLAGDFSCTLAQHFEDITAREAILQLRLTTADERVDVLEGLLFSLPEDLKALSGCENTAGVYACIDYIEQCIAGLQQVTAKQPLY